MQQLIKVNNSDLGFRLKLNYNNVYSRLRMLFGKDSSLFADIRPMSSTTTWYASDDAEYMTLAEAPKSNSRAIMRALATVLKKAKKELDNSKELAPYSDDILQVPGDDYVFYRLLPDGSYKFILAAWGCKHHHAAITEPGGLIRRVSKGADMEETDSNPDERGINGEEAADDNTHTDEQEKKPRRRRFNLKDMSVPDEHEGSGSEKVKEDEGNTDNGLENQEEMEDDISEGDLNVEVEDLQPEPPKKKKQRVVLRVLNQKMLPVEDEEVTVRTQEGEVRGVTNETGRLEIGYLPYHTVFSVAFPNLPNIKERAFEVEPKVEQYDAHIKKYVNYSPVLFVEDQQGNTVTDYDVKVMVAGQDYLLNTGTDGMVQLPMMHDGQKFIVIDCANYANSEEFSVNHDTVKRPFRFTIKRVMKSLVGITVLDKDGKPVEGVAVDIMSGDAPYQKITDKTGRAEFPADIFSPGEMTVRVTAQKLGNREARLEFTPDTTEYTLRFSRRDRRTTMFNWKWLLLLPLLFLLGFGGKVLYDKLHKSDVPTIAEMETGVCLILGQGYYYVDLNVPDIEINGNKTIAYFNYNSNTHEVSNLTFDPDKATVQGWWGTGFLISEDGLIATNKHIAAPAAPDEVAQHLKRAFQNTKDAYQKEADRLNDKLQILGGFGALNQEYANTRDTLRYCQEQVRIFDKLLNTGDYKVQVKSQTRVAFTNTRIEDAEDFIACSQPRAVGDPGGITEKDLAIIKIKKPQDIPAEAFIFTVPDEDIMDGDIPDNYEVTVLGYNAGGNLQDMDLQEGIKPQAQHGKITNRSEKYRVGYDAQIIGGSSGSPVINNKGELVAINNSGYGASQGFNYGVRTKYLKELLDEVRAGHKGGGATAPTPENEKRKKGK